jgi:hypothetical protein
MIALLFLWTATPGALGTGIVNSVAASALLYLKNNPEATSNVTIVTTALIFVFMAVSYIIDHSQTVI